MTASSYSSLISNKNCAEVTINNVKARAFLDSGNLCPCAISAEFMSRLGFNSNNLKPATAPVGTAKKQTSLEVMGRLKSKLCLKFEGCATEFFFAPIVIRDLVMDINLSLSFLEKNRIDQLHSIQKLRLKGGQMINLTQFSLSHATETDKSVSSVYLKEDVEILPNSGMMVVVQPKEEYGRREGIHFLYGRASLNLQRNVEMVPGVNDPQPDGSFKTMVINRGNMPAKLPKNVNMGTVEMVEEEDGTLAGMTSSKEEPGNKEWPKTKHEKLKWIEEQFHISGNAMLNGEQKQEVTNLFLEYFSLFSDGETFGQTKIVEHQIDLKEGTKPIRLKDRKTSPNLLPSLKEQLNNWTSQQVIERSRSPWAFPLVPVKKKGTDKIRWCVDYRALNAQTVGDSYPLPNIQDLLNRIGKKSIFSGIDLAGAYHCVPMREEDRPKTAFSCPYGLYQFKSMPFGLKSAGATFSRLIQQVLQDLPMEIVLYYLDDVLILSENIPDHIRDLTDVLKRFKETGLKLQPKKCHFFTKTIDFLGHRITPEGLSPNPEYCRIIKDWPEPVTVKQLRTFIGKCTYYHKFIKNYNGIAAPLTNLLKKESLQDDRKVFLDDKAKRAFQELKEKLSSPPILGKPLFENDATVSPFILDTDWSAENEAIGAVLSQIQDGRETVISFDSHKLNKTQKHYSSNKGEMFAVLFFIKKYRVYLAHRPFVLRVDNQALKWLKTQDPPSSMVARWLATLADYDFKVEFRPSKKHQNADAMSRLEHVTETANGPPDDIDDDILGVMGIEPINMAKKQQEDETLQQVREWILKENKPVYATQIRKGGWDLRMYSDLYETLFINQDDVIMRRAQPGEVYQVDRICVPRALQEELVKQLHKDNHLKRDKLIDRVLTKYFFPGVYKVVEHVLNDCEACFLKNPQKPQKHTYATVQEGYPFRKLSIDHVGRLKTSSRGNCYILTVKDTFSRYLMAFPTKSLEAQETVRLLTSNVFSVFDFPEQVIMDNHGTFSSALTKELMETLGIKPTYTPAYNPKSNVVERSHKDLGPMLKSLILENPGSDWEDLLPGAVRALNTSRNRHTGMTPHYIMFGREAMTPVDIIYGGVPEEQCKGPHEWVNKLQGRLRSCYAYVRENLKRAVERSRKQYTASQQNRFQIDDQVYLFTPRIDSRVGKKFTSFYTGPYTIIDRVSDVLMKIRPGAWNTRQFEMVVSIDRLSPYKSSKQPMARNLTEEDLAMQDEFLEDIGQMEIHPDEPKPRLYVNYQDGSSIVDITAPPIPKKTEQDDPGNQLSTQPVLEPQETIWELDAGSETHMDNSMDTGQMDNSMDTGDKSDDDPIAHRTRSKQPGSPSDDMC